MHWQTTRFRIALDRPLVMGIVNLTPDSFSDGGALADARAGIAHCERLLADGADILDLGGESTRPGSLPVPADEELARVLPVLDAALGLGCPISIDTNKPAVMAAVLARGADIVNDINALQAPGALDVVAAHATCGVCLMHMRGTPASMQQRPHYDGDVIDEVAAFLRARVGALAGRGIAAERIALDPGIGFGKSVEHNIALLRRQRELLALGRPLLVGWSRKSTLGAITGRAVGERLAASVAAALAAIQLGASVVRVHDVAATVDALKVWRAAGLGAG
ncbi:MAG TPA: dihydropteroate synthase [Burkholderiaceae bacterium]|nr:dihydropteroate synthase [Burkholderiaceae bacterium]